MRDVTTREKSRFIRIVLWEVLQLILLTWVIEKVLNYFFGRLAVKFKGKAHLGDYLNYGLWKLVGLMYLSVYFRYFLSYNTVEKSKIASELRYFPKTVRMVLKTHKDMHKNIDEIKVCPYCMVLRENQNFFQTYAPNPELYPPFKFSRSS